MELKDGKIIATEEEIKCLKSSEGKAFLTEKGLEVEKIVEKDIPLNDEKVQEYLKKNGSLMDKIGNGIRTSFLAKKLGLEEKDVTGDMLGKDLMLKDDLKAFEDKAIKTAVSMGFRGVKHGELLLGQVDYSKLSLKDGNLEGFDTMLEGLKGKYPDMFSEKDPKSKTPPPFGENKTVTKEDFKTMSCQERSLLHSTNKELYDVLTGK